MKRNQGLSLNFIKKFFFGLFFLLSLWEVTQAQLTNPKLAPSLLWEISGNGLEKPSYLYGTIHIMCPEGMNISEPIKTAFENTENLVLELDMDDPEFMTKMQALSVNPGMKNMSDQISDGDKSILNAYFKKHYQADLSQLGILKPFSLLAMMAVKGVDCAQPASYEASFISMAKEGQKEVEGLEEIGDQFAVFDNTPFETQIGWLVSYAKDEIAHKEEFKTMTETYKEGDIEKLFKLMSQSPEYKDLIEDLLYKRNEKWIEKIEANAKEKPTFFAVGAGHLASERGVIKLLRKAGYEVTPVL